MNAPVNQRHHFLPYLVNMIDRLITFLIFVLLILVLGGALPGRSPPDRIAVIDEPDLRSSRASRVKDELASPLPAVPEMEEPPGTDGLPERDRKQADHDEAKNLCAAFPKKGEGFRRRWRLHARMTALREGSLRVAAPVLAGLLPRSHWTMR